jgi:hypothetical protein
MALEQVINLETADASITTATVTIKALQVGKKQMTLSVFRQLPEARLVDEDMVKLLGQPWGYVNYRWGDQTGTNFIFQAESRLYRACFLIRESEELSGRDSPNGYAELRTMVYGLVDDLFYAQVANGKVPEWYESDGHDREVTVSLTGFSGWETTIALDDDIKFLLRSHKRIHTGEMAEKVKEASIAKAANIVQRLQGKYGTNYETRIKSMFDIVSSEVLAYCKRWDELMEQLRAVEQLYIAV